MDNKKELALLQELARERDKHVEVLFRIIPGIDLDTHDHIKTGHHSSKFGIPLSELDELIAMTLKADSRVKLLGLHAHIGSQAMELEPYLEEIDLFADLYAGIQAKFGVNLPHLDLGGGIGIAYTDADKPLNLQVWAQALSQRVQSAFQVKCPHLPLPELSLEPGRAIIGTAGVTIYTSGFTKQADGVNYLPVDGGMADNPRPITYQALYTAAVANRMAGRSEEEKTWSIVGRYCESGDIIVEGARLDVESGDLIAVFATGAYNYSMSSNYNRTGRPACVLVRNGQAAVIVERETCTDLISHDRIASWLG